MVVCVVVATALPAVASLRDPGTVTGVVFEDLAANGVLDGRDPRLAGVTVSAYDSASADVGTAVSGLDGTYSLTVASNATTDLRVDFATPA